jgi:hypothetical protein
LISGAARCLPSDRLAALSRHLAIPLLSALIVATFFNVCGGAVLARPKQHKIAWA